MFDGTGGYSGFLFIGDPHVASKGVERRKDGDFCLTVVGKLEFSLNLAESLGLKPVILGDLFDNCDDAGQLMTTRMIRLLAGRRPPLTLIGNHERRHSIITDDTSVAALREAGLLETLESPGFFGVFEMGGRRVALGGTPHGFELPESVDREGLDADIVVWLTHHDLAFENSYPGAVEIREIAGVDIMVNGHLHKTSKPVTRGAMTAHNPGNITRMSVDCRDHVPKVAVWRPDMGSAMELVAVPAKADVFDMTGLMSKPEKQVPKVSEAMAEAAGAKFAQMLVEHSAGDFKKSADAVYTKEDLEAVFASLGTTPAARALVFEMLSEVMAEDCK